MFVQVGYVFYSKRPNRDYSRIKWQCDFTVNMAYYCSSILQYKDSSAAPLFPCVLHESSTGEDEEAEFFPGTFSIIM